MITDETWTFTINYEIAPPEAPPKEEGLGLLLLAGIALLALSEKEKR